nr:LabA-like/DUF88 superfamily protein [Oceanusvirus sp.]
MSLPFLFRVAAKPHRQTASVFPAAMRRFFDRSQSSSENKKSSAGVFIDSDNVSPMCAERAVEYARSQYDVRRVVVYRDWKGKESKLRDVCERVGAEQVQVSNARGKNSTDIRMAIDVTAELLTSDTENYVLVTNDSDFRHLLLKIREQGRRSVVFNCVPKPSRLLQGWCDDYRSGKE